MNWRSNPRVRTWVCVAALIALWGVMSFWRMKGPIDLRYDGSVYYILGTSLAQGKGYRLLNEPGEIEAVQYPPLLPAIVAAHQWALGTDDIFVVGHALRLTYLGFYLALILLAFAYARRYLGDLGALAVGSLTALNFFTYYLSDMLFTEIPFAIVTLLFLLVAERETRWSTPLGFLFAAAAYLLRTSGIALLAAWIVDAALKRRFRLLIVRAALAALPVLAWQTYIHRVQASEDYRSPAYAYQRAPYLFYNVTYGENLSLTDPYKPELGLLTPTQTAKRFLSNLIRFPIKLGEGVSIRRDFWSWPFYQFAKSFGWDWGKETSNSFYLLLRPILLVIGVLVLVGGAAMLIAPARLSALYAGAASVLICTTPWPSQAPRYLMPLIPILALALIRGIGLLADKTGHLFSGRRMVGRRCALGVVLAPILAIQSLTVFLSYRHSFNSITHRDREGLEIEAAYFYFSEPWVGLERALEWTQKEVPSGSVIATISPHYFYLRSSLFSVMPPFEVDQDRFHELSESVPLGFIIVDRIKDLDVARRYAEPALVSAPDRWRVAFEDEAGGVKVYERIHVPE